MKQLVVARHGEDEGGVLDDLGRAQMRRLAEALKPLMNGARVLILSSTADRAFASAQILGLFLGAKVEKHAILWSESVFIPTDLPGTLKLVLSRMKRADVLIVVTHHEYAQYFPSYFAREELGVEISPDPIRKGEAWVIDCLQKTITHMKP